jgi:hypothetical protein
MPSPPAPGPQPTPPQPPNLDALVQVYCTDEDICVRSQADFPFILPASQELCSGTDGAFAAASGGSWVLTSASVLFQTQGLAKGHVLQLTGPAPYFNPNQGKTGRLLFAVESVTDAGCCLRVPGLAANLGTPPGPAAGLSGVSFVCRTLGPQIGSAVLELNHRFGIDPNVGQKSPAYVYDPDGQLRQLTVLSVLVRQYDAYARTNDSDLVRKKAQYESEYREALARAAIKYGSLGEGEAPATQLRLRVRR